MVFVGVCCFRAVSVLVFVAVVVCMCCVLYDVCSLLVCVVVCLFLFV